MVTKKGHCSPGEAVRQIINRDFFQIISDSSPFVSNCSPFVSDYYRAPFPFLVIWTMFPIIVGLNLTSPALVTLYQKACISQAAVGQRSAQRPQWRQTSSSLTMTRPVLRPSST